MITLVVFVLVLGFLILIHEGGHFFAARLARVWVHEFAVGFGPALWKRKARETLYALRLIPVGGYVRMAGEVEGAPDRPDEATASAEEIVPPERLFSTKSPWARIGIISAGPITNIVGAVIIMILAVASFGTPYVEVVSFTAADSPAAQTLQAGDVIVAINGERIYSTSQIAGLVNASGERPLTLEVRRNGAPLALTVTPRWVPDQGRFLIGAFFAIAQTNVVTQVAPDAYLAQLGLQRGDRIVALNDRSITSVRTLFEALQALDEGEPVTLGVQRGEERLTLELDLGERSVESVFRGLAFETPTRRLGALESVTVGLQQTWNLTLGFYQGLRSIIAGQISPGEAFSGPVGIANILGQGLQQGWLPFFQLVAILSLNLGILNLLPFPALDGSRLAFIAIELARGRPVSPRTEGLIHQIGFIALLALILLITYNDILKLFR